ncbi:hypothetical protein D3C72_2185440 [compost metagenome]
MGTSGHIDLDQPHVPLLFISGTEDEIIPAALVEKNSKAYEDKNSIVEYAEFAGRSHYICNEPGWEQVADRVNTFLTQQA